MSIQTDLTRLQSAKAAIKAAIEGKGVTVPDATLLNGMAALIESIQAGGGKCVEGTFIVNSSSFSKFTFEHNLGAIPTFALIYAGDGTVVSGARYRKGGGFVCLNPEAETADGMFFLLSMSSSNSTKFSLSGNNDNGGYMLTQSSGSGSNCQFNSLSTTKISWVGTYSYRTYLLPGIEYRYIVGVF